MASPPVPSDRILSAAALTAAFGSGACPDCPRQGRDCWDQSETVECVEVGASHPVWALGAPTAGASSRTDPRGGLPYPLTPFIVFLSRASLSRRLVPFSVRQRNTTRCGSDAAGTGSGTPALLELGARAPGPVHTPTAVERTSATPQGVEADSSDANGARAAKSRRIDLGNTAGPTSPSPQVGIPPPPGYFYFMLNKKPGTTSMRSPSDKKKISVYDELPPG